MVGRYGGEEFLVVLNHCEPASALARAENLREAIARRPVATRGKSVPVTISVGLALSTDFACGEADDMIQEADAALYAAKREGRNCVRTARNGEGHPEADAAIKAETTLRMK
jgi:diguanylate cyclase (GGDEF)-like protein